jgi:hypothetical protein
MSDTSTTGGICAGTYSKYYDVCAGSCGVTQQNGCVVIELEYKYTPIPANGSTRFPTASPSSSPTVYVGPTPSPSIAPSDFISQLQKVNVFQYTGIAESFIVPEGVEAFYVYMWGAGGGYFSDNGAY